MTECLDSRFPSLAKKKGDHSLLAGSLLSVSIIGWESGLTIWASLSASRLCGCGSKECIGCMTGQRCCIVREPVASWVRVPVGVLTVMNWLSPVEHSILYPGGKNVLKPEMSTGWPLKSMETCSIRPGVVSLELPQVSKARWIWNQWYGSHLAFKILHNVQELVVHVWIILEAIFDFVEIAKHTADIEWMIAGRSWWRECWGRWWCQWCWGSCCECMHIGYCRCRSSPREQLSHCLMNPQMSSFLDSWNSLAWDVTWRC